MDQDTEDRVTSERNWTTFWGISWTDLVRQRESHWGHTDEMYLQFRSLWLTRLSVLFNNRCPHCSIQYFSSQKLTIPQPSLSFVPLCILQRYDTNTVLYCKTCNFAPPPETSHRVFKVFCTNPSWISHWLLKQTYFLGKISLCWRETIHDFTVQSTLTALRSNLVLTNSCNKVGQVGVWQDHHTHHTVHFRRQLIWWIWLTWN